MNSDQALKRIPIQISLSISALTIFVLIPFFIKSPYVQHIFIFIFIYVTLGSSWNIIGGFAGQWALGHAAFFGIGAYTSTLLLLHFNLTPWVGMVVGGLVAIAVSLCIGFPCFRLRTHYFAMATLTFGEIMRLIFLWLPFTEGAGGLILPVTRIPSVYYMLWASKLPYYYIGFFFAVGTILINCQINRSRAGIYLKAVKQDEEAARNLGIDATKYKLTAMGMSAFLTALTGSLYAQYIQYIDPEAVMPFMLSLFMVLIPIFGGLGTIWGPVLGALILTPIAEISRVLLGGKGAGIDMLLYGIVIIIFSLYFPGGLISYIKNLKAVRQLAS